MSTAYQYIALRCPIHNLAIQQVNLLKNVPIGERLQCECCRLCNPTHLSEAIQLWEIHKKKEIIQRDNECEKCIGQIEGLMIGLDHLKKTFNEQIETSITLFQSVKSSIMDQQMEIIRKINTMDEQLTISNLQQIAEILSENSKIIHLDLQTYFPQDYLKEMHEMITKCKVSICELKSVNEKLQAAYTLAQNKMKAVEIISIKSQLQNSLAIAFNNNNTIMAQGFNNIEIWNFNQGNMNYKQTLYGHTDKITFLNFSKSENILVSGSQDKTVKIWKEINHNFELVNTLIIKECITGLLIKDNQVIVSTEKGQIQIWKGSMHGFQECEQLQELIHSDGFIYNICLNESGSQLASCGQDMKIKIWNNNYGWWIPGVSIQFPTYGFRVAFVDENELIWQGINGKTIYYQINNKEFHKLDQKLLNDEQTDSVLFPSIYSNSILLQKHNKFIYFIKKTQLQKLQVLHKIECQTSDIYGTMTSDGQYLVYNDTQQKKLKILKIHYDYML